jgi:hypothetical protein
MGEGVAEHPAPAPMNNSMTFVAVRIDVEANVEASFPRSAFDGRKRGSGHIRCTFVDLDVAFVDPPPPDVCATIASVEPSVFSFDGSVVSVRGIRTNVDRTFAWR